MRALLFSSALLLDATLFGGRAKLNFESLERARFSLESIVLWHQQQHRSRFFHPFSAHSVPPLNKCDQSLPPPPKRSCAISELSQLLHFSKPFQSGRKEAAAF